MRQHLAKLAPAFLVGGCSLIYNPSNIDKPMADARLIDMGEVPIDIEIRADAMPRDLTITEAWPTTVDEGSGTGGSRAAVVVLRGEHFVKNADANLMVMIAPATAGAAVLDSFEVSGNGDYIALAINVPVDTACADGTTVDVDVTVMQNDGAGGTVSQTLDNAFAVTCLDELDAAPTTTTGLKALYSRIEIAGDVTFTAGVAPAAILRSASSINIGGTLDASALAREPGPGGGRGGAGGNGSTVTTAAMAGGAGEGLAGGSGGAAGAKNGGGAGYVMTGGAGSDGGAAGGGMAGDVWIASHAGNRSSGGGGGGGAGVLGVASPDGGAGGGGGGTVELTAPGTITVGAISANGGDGTATSAGDGGAGSGGTVLIRSGAMLTASTVQVVKGTPGTGGGGTSSDGRVRVDAAAGTYPGNAQRGPMFVDVPTRVTVQTPILNLRGTNNDATATLRVFDKAGNAVAGMTYMPVFGPNGTAQVSPVLKAGYNKVCVWVDDGSFDVEESINCVEIAYLPL